MPDKYSFIKIPIIHQCMSFTDMAYRIFILVTIFVTFVQSFTISNVDPLLPTQFILTDRAFTRITPLQPPMLITCPPDTFLNKDTLTCDFKSNAEFVATSLESGNQCTFGGGTVQPAENCRNYLLCGPSGSYVMNCPGLLLFNRESSCCDYRQNANCCEFKVKNTEVLLQDV